MRDERYAVCYLAGGQARRMGGGDKGEIVIAGQTILSSLIARYGDAPYQFINANGALDRFAHYGLDIVPDTLPDYQGPLAGIYAAMEHLKAHHPTIKWLACLPTDAPLLPDSLITDMLDHAMIQQIPLVSVTSNERTHPVIGLWSLSLYEALKSALLEQGVRKIDAFTSAHGCAYLDYQAEEDPFLNLNRPEDLTAYLASITIK